MRKLGSILVGSGPAGLGGAAALETRRCLDWTLLESSDTSGGLASSFVDPAGFTWDIGGHVQFSHYEYFDRVMDDLLGADGWLEHQRESWVWMRGRFVPYPFQNNVHRLPAEDLERCLAGLVDIQRAGAGRPGHFGEWIESRFGAGIAEVFMVPYNFKVWAYPPEMLSASWVGERVATTDLKRVLGNLVHQRDDVSWGPNNKFRFPLRGGTGAIWKECARRLPQDKIRLGTRVTRVDLEGHRLWTDKGEEYSYDALISTMPLTELIRCAGLTQFEPLARKGLLHSSSNIVGIGLEGQVPEHLRTKCWMYFPEDDCPFYRVTVFSNYSPYNVPDSTRHWSLMAEVSESPMRPVDQETLVAEVIQGLRNTGLIGEGDRIVSTWQHRAAYGYPTPGLHRDEALGEILPYLEQYDVYSRGRFGAWKYEVSNQDHSFMQGVEIVERLLTGRPEITVNDPEHANSRKHPWPFERWSEYDRAKADGARGNTDAAAAAAGG